jgi:hypothetical protein
MPVGGDMGLYASNIHKAHALSDGGEERANPLSSTTKKDINNEAYDITNHRIPTLGWD